MKITEVETYLAKKNNVLKKEVKKQLEALLQNAIKYRNETQANYIWCLRQIYLIQNEFLIAFRNMKNNEFEKAWLELDRADIMLGELEENFDINEDDDKYHMVFIGNQLKEYQKLFPYKLFLSREMVVEEEKCSICGKVVALRDHCSHEKGKLYMGKICCHEVTKAHLKAFAIVTDPFDKYTFLKIEGIDFDYSDLQSVVNRIKSPYDKFHVDIERDNEPIETDSNLTSGYLEKDGDQSAPKYLIYKQKHTIVFDS